MLLKNKSTNPETLTFIDRVQHNIPAFFSKMPPNRQLTGPIERLDEKLKFTLFVCAGVLNVSSNGAPVGQTIASPLDNTYTELASLSFTSDFSTAFNVRQAITGPLPTTVFNGGWTAITSGAKIDTTMKNVGDVPSDWHPPP